MRLNQWYCTFPGERRRGSLSVFICHSLVVHQYLFSTYAQSLLKTQKCSPQGSVQYHFCAMEPSGNLGSLQTLSQNMFWKIQNKLHNITKEANYTEKLLLKYSDHLETQCSLDFKKRKKILWKANWWCSNTCPLRSRNLMEDVTRAEAGKVIKFTNWKYFLNMFIDIIVLRPQHDKSQMISKEGSKYPYSRGFNQSWFSWPYQHSWAPKIPQPWLLRLHTYLHLLLLSPPLFLCSFCSSSNFWIQMCP